MSAFDQRTQSAGFAPRGWSMNDPSSVPAARSYSGEEVIVRYTRGTGRFSPDKRFIALSMSMFDATGRPDGHHEGVWEAMFHDPSELLARPGDPGGGFDIPEGPVPALDPSAQTKGIWVFGDNSSVTAIGAAMSHLVPLPDGSFLFLVSCAQVIVDGAGRYAGAYGLKTSLGSTHVARGVNLFGPGDVSFEATTVDTFRIARATEVGYGRAPGPR